MRRVLPVEAKMVPKMRAATQMTLMMSEALRLETSLGSLER